MNKEELLRIKKDILGIIKNYHKGTCLCTMRESCDVCSSYPTIHGISSDVASYIDDLINK